MFVLYEVNSRHLAHQPQLRKFVANGSGDALEYPLDNRIVLIAFGQPEDIDGSEVGRDFNGRDLKIERIYRSNKGNICTIAPPT